MHQVNSFFNFLDKGLIQLYFSTDFLLRIREKNPYITQYILSGNPRKLVWSCYIFLNGSSPSVFHLSIYLSDWLVTEWSSTKYCQLKYKLVIKNTQRVFIFIRNRKKSHTQSETYLIYSKGKKSRYTIIFVPYDTNITCF